MSFYLKTPASPLRRSAPGSLLKSSSKDLRTSSSRGLAASFEAGGKYVCLAAIYVGIV